MIDLPWLKAKGILTKDGPTKITWKDETSATKKTVLVWIEMGVNSSRIRFIHKTKERVMDYKYDLTTSKCNYGGERKWFICGQRKNNQICGNRVSHLYQTNGYPHFACRDCLNLSYASRNTSGIYRKVGNYTFKDLHMMREKIKRRTYDGKITKKYKIYIQRAEKLYEGVMKAPFLTKFTN